MGEHKVLFLPHNKEITVLDGERLIRAAMEAGVHITACKAPAVEKGYAGNAGLL